MVDDAPSLTSSRTRYARKSYSLRPGYRKHDITSPLMTEEEKAIRFFASIRWGEDWERTQACPECGVIAQHYKYKARWRWTCCECAKQFTVFSNTRLHSTKLPAHKILQILFQFVEAKDSKSAREVSGLYNLNYQTVHVLFLKIREGLADSMLADPPLSGFIQADAAYFIKYVRPGNIGTGAAFAAKADRQKAGKEEMENKKKKEKDKPKNAGLDENGKVAAETKSTVHPNMHALVVFVQMGLQGDRRYKVAKIKTETQLDMQTLGPRFCTANSTLVTDQAGAYLVFGLFRGGHHRINHKEHFRDPEGFHTNLAENFFSRIRSAQSGAWHRMSIQYLELYGWEFAWRLTMVGSSNDAQLKDLARRLLTSGRARHFVDYWCKRGPRDRCDADDVGTAVEVDKNSLGKKMGRPSKESLSLLDKDELAARLAANDGSSSEERSV